MKSVTVLVPSSLIAMAAPALAQSDRPSFAKLDANYDGLISRDEAQANERVAAGFEDADQDRDGSLIVEEFAAMWQ